MAVDWRRNNRGSGAEQPSLDATALLVENADARQSRRRADPSISDHTDSVVNTRQITVVERVGQLILV